MTDRLKGIEEWLTAMKPSLAAVDTYSWVGPDEDQFWEFLRRAVIKRQYEALEVLLKMCRDGYGHFGVTFIRPAYEEFLWITYLSQNRAIAAELVRLLVRLEVGDNITAQRQYAGAKAMVDLGFSKAFTTAFLKENENIKLRMREIGTQLGWDMARGMLPTPFWLSKKLGHVREFQFLYQGTSRFVHFSVQENLRRVWGQSGEVHIGSGSFSRFWEEFALYWAFRIFIYLLSEVHDATGPMTFTEEEGKRLTDIISSQSVMPIVTMEEILPWPRNRVEPENQAPPDSTGT